MNLNWEITSTGQKAILVPRKVITGPILGGVVHSKVNDIAWVSASFRGERVGFEPYVRLWKKEGKDVTGLAVLMHDYPNGGESSALPDTCLRWAEWQEKQAVQGFVSADDKLRYVRDDMFLRCALRFYRADEIGIDRLMERTSAILARGVAFVKVDRPELDRREATFEFCNGALFYQFSYFPGSFSNEPLEQLIQEWLDAARSLQSRPDHPPDEGFQIAYRESIWEQVARYGESQ